MFLELHIIQNFAPSNLNRDDTGSPKTADFGGFRRARISSQSIKRSVRTGFKSGLLPDEYVAVRSKRFRDQLVNNLVSIGRPEDESKNIVSAAFGGLGIMFSNDGEGEEIENKSQYLIFAGPNELHRFGEICQGNWDTLQESFDSGCKDARGGVPAKNNAERAVPAPLRTDLLGSLNGGKAVDLALFGRMLADIPDKNIDAASQVAHAISTHQVNNEFDYYTAIDDLKPTDTQGADMIGTIEFNSACFYRYSNINLDLLSSNLDNDRTLAVSAIEAFLTASVEAIPTGKQSSFAAQSPPSLILTVLRSRGLWSLANSFVMPARADYQGDLLGNSINMLDKHWGDLSGMYGEDGIQGKWVATTNPDSLSSLRESIVTSFPELRQQTVEQARSYLEV